MLSKQQLVLLMLAAWTTVVTSSPTEHPVCQHGQAYIDQCDNECSCLKNGDYGCTRKACRDPDAVSGSPRPCSSSMPERRENGQRIFCLAGIVQFQSEANPEQCTTGTAWLADCNQCTCTSPGDFSICTLKACHSSDAIIFESGSDHGTPEAEPSHHGASEAEPSDHVYPEAEPSDHGASEAEPSHHGASAAEPSHHGASEAEPSDPETAEHEPQLHYGDTTVHLDNHCPAGLINGGDHGDVRICRANGCSKDAQWMLSDGCSSCVCLENGEPACGPCDRQATDETLTCDGHSECPADCGRDYDPVHDCYQCCQEEPTIGDPQHIGEPCPPGTLATRYGWARVWCATPDQIPRGETRICEPDVAECPADCGLTHNDTEEGCIYCDCHAPTESPEPCQPGDVAAHGCDTCMCLEAGYMACTKRDCSLEFDLRTCGVDQCPADCGLVSEQDGCVYCSCSQEPYLVPGEISVGADEECPEGYAEVRQDFASKICVQMPTPEPNV